MLINLKSINFYRILIYLIVIIWLHFVYFDQKVKSQIQANKIYSKWQVRLFFASPDHGGFGGRDLARAKSVTLVEGRFGAEDVTGVLGICTPDKARCAFNDVLA